MIDGIEKSFDAYLAFLDSIRTNKTATRSTEEVEFNLLSKSFEKHWPGESIPNEVVSLLTITKENSGVIDPFEFCNESMLVELWKLRLEMQRENSARENSTSGFPEACIRPAKSIRSDLDWRARWIPIARRENDLIFIDFDPAEKGTSGQVVLFNGSARTLSVIGANVTEFIDGLKKAGGYIRPYRTLPRILKVEEYSLI